MVDKIVPRYMYQKDGTYYFSRHVPNDVRHHYACDRIVICLKTSSEYAAINASKSISGKLDDYWMLYQRISRGANREVTMPVLIPYLPSSPENLCNSIFGHRFCTTSTP